MTSFTSVSDATSSTIDVKRTDFRGVSESTSLPARKSNAECDEERPPNPRRRSRRTRLDPVREENASDNLLKAECDCGVRGADEVDAEGEVERLGLEVDVILDVFFSDGRRGGCASRWEADMDMDCEDETEWGRC